MKYRPDIESGYFTKIAATRTVKAIRNGEISLDNQEQLDAFNKRYSQGNQGIDPLAARLLDAKMKGKVDLRKNNTDTYHVNATQPPNTKHRVLHNLVPHDGGSRYGVSIALMDNHGIAERRMSESTSFNVSATSAAMRKHPEIFPHVYGVNGMQPIMFDKNTHKTRTGKAMFTELVGGPSASQLPTDQRVTALKDLSESMANQGIHQHEQRGMYGRQFQDHHNQYRITNVNSDSVSIHPRTGKPVITHPIIYNDKMSPVPVSKTKFMGRGSLLDMGPIRRGLQGIKR